jgi:hypothetical protein
MCTLKIDSKVVRKWLARSLAEMMQIKSNHKTYQEQWKARIWGREKLHN